MKPTLYETRINIPNTGTIDVGVKLMGSFQDDNGGFVDGWQGRIDINAFVVKTADEAKKRLVTMLRAALDKLESGE